MSILGLIGTKWPDLTALCATEYTRSEYDFVWPDDPEGWGEAHAEYAELCIHEAIWPGLQIGNLELASGALDGVEGEGDLSSDELLTEINETELDGGGLLGADVQGAGIGAATPNAQAVTGGGFTLVTPTVAPRSLGLTYTASTTDAVHVSPVPLDIASGWLLAVSITALVGFRVLIK